MGMVGMASMALRISALLALLLGLGLWSGNGTNLVTLHMALGIVAVVSVWALGLMQARVRGGSVGLAVGAIILGLVLPIVGIGQLAFFAGGGRLAAQLVHVIVAFAVIGIGEACTGRIRRAQAGVPLAT